MIEGYGFKQNDGKEYTNIKRKQYSHYLSQLKNLKYFLFIILRAEFVMRIMRAKNRKVP